ncbi:MAG: hypothetical protein MR210_07760 [Erysipelotrichaceae bacterium]|nr:hypothetical protein [Erysipelotrichaceae bacterium]MDY5252270.1 hypothetical protein [Erysipelotrichaceae bacterium]
MKRTKMVAILLLACLLLRVVLINVTFLAEPLLLGVIGLFCCLIIALILDFIKPI